MPPKKNSIVAVLISDLHFTVATLEIATKALVSARNYALEYGVPLVIAGDTLDTKAIIRGECSNRLIEIFSSHPSPDTYLIVGNHDLISEKSKEHVLNFLRPYCIVVDEPVWESSVGSYLIPYHSDSEDLKRYLATIPKGSRLIMHQGVQGANMGHYVQDTTSITKHVFKDFRVISGHYHEAQDVECGKPQKGLTGVFSYIGTPYTTSYAEANSECKGFRVLYEDGSLKTISLKLRKHVIVEKTMEDLFEPIKEINKDDLVWVKVTGYRSQRDSIDKAALGKHLFGHTNYKLDFIPIDNEIVTNAAQGTTPSIVLDSLIDSLSETEPQKTKLKYLWKELLS